MALQPSTQFQVAQDAILDYTGQRQVYLGNSFILPDNGTSLTTTAETPLAYILNPTGSPKSLFIYSKKIGTDNNNVIIRFYANPTVSVLGAATVAGNLRSGSSTTSVSRCYLSPTFSSNGALIAPLLATIYSITSNILSIFDPGSALLVTGQQSLSGTTTAYLEIAWYEL